jgi:hypothetical protein
VWISLSIFQAPFPSWKEGYILKSRFCLTTMSPQAGLGRHQGGGLNCWGVLLGSVIWVLHSPGWRFLHLFLRSQGVGSGSLASENYMGSGESQVVLRRTLCLLQKMPSSICHFGVIATGFLRLSNWTCLLVCSSLLSFFLCKSIAWTLDSLCHPFSVKCFVKTWSHKPLPGVASKHDPPDLFLLSS